MKGFAERKADRSPFDLGLIHVPVHELRLTDIEVCIQRRIRPVRFLSQFIDLIRTLLPGQMLDVRHLKTRRDLLRSDAALPGKVEQI